MRRRAYLASVGAAATVGLAGCDGTSTPDGGGSPPATPANVRVVRAWPRSAEVAWDEPADPDGDDVVEYRVRVDDREPRPVAGTDASVTLTDVEPGANHSVTVAAVDEHGLRSSPSAPVTVAVPEEGAPFAVVPRAPATPGVDAAVDDAWSSADAHAIDDDVWGNAGDYDFGGRWRVLWDEAALYVLVTVDDDDEWVDSDGAWKNDHVEVYLDLDNSRGSSYDGRNDLHLVVERGSTVVHPGPNSASDVDPIAAGVAETDGGWRAELAVPWAHYGVDPSPGHVLGIDVHVDEDDDGGDRDSKLTWYDTTDRAYEKPKLFGTVELGE